jgi:hypothetical protein
MGAMKQFYREQWPEPDEDDLWIYEMTQVMQAKRERHTRRYERILAVLHGAAPDTLDETEVFV